MDKRTDDQNRQHKPVFRLTMKGWAYAIAFSVLLWILIYLGLKLLLLDFILKALQNIH